jgi:hypothetical protein
MALRTTRQFLEALVSTTPLSVVYTVSADSTLSLSDAATFVGTRAFSALTTLDLAATAGVAKALGLAAESAINPDATAAVTTVLNVAAESILELSQTARSSEGFEAESSLDLATTASCSMVRLVAASSALDLAVAAGCVKSAIAADFLTLSDTAGVVVVRSLAAENVLALSQAAPVARPWYVSAESVIQTAREEYDQATDTFYPVYEGLRDAADVARPLEALASQVIALEQSASAVRVRPGAIELSAESVLELLSEVRTNQTGAAGNWLVLGQAAAVDTCKLVKSVLALADQASAVKTRPRGAASALSLGQSATFSIVFGGVLQQYHPFVGEGAAGSPTPPSVTVGLPEQTDIPFQLYYPAEGLVSDSVTLRAPNLGNKDRLSFNRIVRETRGGTLIVFADPIWPKVQTLVLTFSGLHNAQKQQLLAFLDAHLGQEIGLLDWEGRHWKGVIMTPTDPVVQDARDSFSASMEFEGELVPA